MVVLNGTRTDVIYYDDNMGCSSSDFGLFYTVQMQQVSAPYVWLPSCDKPEPWAGTYVLAPFWLLASVPLAIMCLLWLTRSPRAGHCPECGYNLRGLGAAPTCPECGATARNPRIPKPSPN
jgi:hypothetical protein